MQFIIWILDENKKRIIENQRLVNSSGSMKAVCILSTEALKKNLLSGDNNLSKFSVPSLIAFNYEFAAKNDFEAVTFIRERERLSGVPMFFSLEERSPEMDEYCYSNGALVVIHSIFNEADILRIERMAWQYENTRQYESQIQNALAEIHSAKEIRRLNELLESRNRLLHKVFERYFSDEVVELIMEQGEDVSLGGEKVNATVMMSDLRNFTSLSEQMDAEKVTALLNYYFGKMVDIINHYRGTVIEFIGDGLLTVFGAPIKSVSATDNAVAAAIGMQNIMPEINEYCRKNGFPHLEMGIGLHYGEVFIGNIGSEKIMRYNVIGSTVNECSRIEGCTVGGQILVSERILKNTLSQVVTTSESCVKAKGLINPVKVYDVIGIGGEYGAVLWGTLTDTDIPLPDDRDTVIQIHPVREKMVGDDFFTVRVTALSLKRMVVEPVGGDCYFEMFSDVNISYDQEMSDGMAGIYVKVTGREAGGWVLSYTDSSEKTRSFIERITETESGQ